MKQQKPSWSRNSQGRFQSCSEHLRYDIFGEKSKREKRDCNFIRLAKHKSIHLGIINVIWSLVEPIAYYFFSYSIHECKPLAWWLPDSSHHHRCQSSGALNKLPFDDYLRLLPISLKILRLAEKCLIENQVASNFSWSLFAAQSTKLETEHTVVSTNCRLLSQFSKPIDDINPIPFLLFTHPGFFSEGFKAFKIVTRMEYVISFVLNGAFLQ